MTVKKAWGMERWLCNRPIEAFCAKILYLKSGWQCSLHMHPRKAESFFVLRGVVDLEIGDEQFTVLPSWKEYHVPAGTYHRFANREGEQAVILEVSSFHSDNDVQRKEDSRQIKL